MVPSAYYGPLPAAGSRLGKSRAGWSPLDGRSVGRDRSARRTDGRDRTCNRMRHRRKRLSLLDLLARLLSLVRALVRDRAKLTG
jgi:hypothetical protein